MTTHTQIYKPALHSNGALLVEVSDDTGQFCGWADTDDTYGRVGTWELCDVWAPAQAAALGRRIASAREIGPVRIEEHGIARHVTVEF